MKLMRLISILAILAFLMGSVAPVTARDTRSAGQAASVTPTKQTTKTSTDDALRKIEPDLRATAQAGGSQLVKVTILVKPGADLSRYFEKILVRPGKELDRVIGMTKASNLLKLASLDGTLAVLTMEQRAALPDIKKQADLDEVQPVKQNLATARPVPMDRATMRAANRVKTPAPESFFTNDTNGVKATWAQGITGDGGALDPVKVAIIDTGVDFANPDLFGTQARVTDPTSHYFGWPIAFDDRSMSEYALDVQDYRGNWGWYMDTTLEIQDPSLVSTATFTFTVTHPDWGTEYVYAVGSGIQELNTNSGFYHFGWHPDDGLAAGWGETLGVLVSGEGDGSWGAYDTVYVDLFDDYSFDNDGSEGWATLGQEIACANLGWSAPTSCDISGGMIYFIANGTDPVPASDWMYGLGVPAAGTLVAFMVNDYTESGGDHGTLCAGTAIGQGIIDLMPYAGTYGSTYWPPAWYDPATEGISEGPAKDAGLVAMGNFYQGGSGLNYYDFLVLGYDGVPAGAVGDHFDQPHIASNSYGSGSVENDGWDLSSRYVTLLNNGYVAQYGIELPDGGAQSVLFVKSSGNSGTGYGTVNSPGAETGIMVGTDTVFGQFNLGDTAWARDQVNWGDLGYFSDRGPSALSTIKPHVLGNGFFGSGNVPLNYFYGGDWSVDFWSGTSRSSPEVSGILALIFDAYYQKNGVYPGWREARSLLMNGARTLYNDPFAQGAGLANALNSVEIISGTRGVEVTASDGDASWVVGDYRGAKYESFARGLFAGESDSETFTVANFGAADAHLDLQPVTLELYHTREWNFTSLPLAQEAPTGGTTRYYDRRLYGPAGSNKGFGGDDPLFLSESVTDTALLRDADLMVIRLSYPFEQFQNLAVANGNWWFVYDFAWRDASTDGSWFNDTNGNRVRNSLETQSPTELVRVNYAYNGNTVELRVREPWARLNGEVGPNEPALAAMTDQLIAIRHYYYGAFDTTDLSVTIELYKETEWSDVVLNTNELHVTAGSTATFDATANAAADMPAGEYTGYIKVSYTDPFEYAEYVPVNMQVWFPMTIDPQLGGVDEPTLYDNGVMFGGIGPSAAGQRAESGDWRFFYTDVTEIPTKASYLLAHTTWQAEGDAPDDTDIDTLIFGPEVTNSLFTGFESLFGPSGLNVVGGSLRVGSAPDWEYYTTTGGPDDWSSALLSSEGLFGVAAQVVRWGGELTRVPYTINVGTAQVDPSSISITGAGCNPCSKTLTFKTNHADLEGETLEAVAYGFNVPVQETLPITQNETVVFTYTVTVTDAYMLDIRTSLPEPGYDIDLTVIFNGDVVGTSAGADSEEQVTLSSPAAGDYRIEVFGYGVPAPHDFDLFVEEISGLGAFSVSNIPASIALGQEYTLSLDFTVVPTDVNRLGMLLLGPVGSPDAIAVPVFVYNNNVALMYHDLEDVVAMGEDVYVVGGFNNWSTTSNMMTANGDYSVFTASVSAIPGSYEYKYFIPSLWDWANWDMLNTSNRNLTATENTEVHDYRKVNVGWAHLGDPTDFMIRQGESSGNLIGEVYINNVTNPAGEGRGIKAQLGYGTNSDPNTWTWMDMTYLGDSGNNDQFVAAFTPADQGEYFFGVRFDGNWGIGNPNMGWTPGDRSGTLTVVKDFLFMPFISK